MPSSSADIRNTSLRLTLVTAVLMLGGCLSGPPAGNMPQGVSAIQVSADKQDLMWERAVAILNNYHFMVARESKIEGVIETEYRAGSNLFEPWHHDSVGYANRLESTVQSIRRKAIVTFQNSSPGLVTISVRVDKEIEDVPGLAANYEGGATFSESQLLDRNLDQVVGQAGASRWLHRGTDPALEAELMRQIQSAVIR
ncbi:hypothetical protein [Fuerstiella marisgermanici]|uniref:Uncharacterized protein n=1 Tax=Fuerstiella marisgermanici TaxID=1891926 RepID=A0A1P8WG24_9PLAN|nr:hypothetical protein [Fuerstiella marisgermanici]APZ93021.1 hypothetical protein Fuma_02634 [Fuerstiella marisgermanici]